MKVSTQEILTKVKEIRGGLIGISRLNKALHRSLDNKCNSLEKLLVSSCDALMEKIPNEETKVPEAQEAAAEAESVSEEEKDALIGAANGTDSEGKEPVVAPPAPIASLADIVPTPAGKMGRPPLPKPSLESEDEDDLLSKL